MTDEEVVRIPEIDPRPVQVTQGSPAKQIADLITKLESATGPSRELDGEIHNGLHGTQYLRSTASVTGFFTSETDNGCPSVDHYTASIDAAVALVERVLPGWHWTISNNNRRFTDQEWKGPWASISSDEFNNDISGHDDDYFDAFAPTPALALVIAALRALSPKEQRK